MHANIRIFEADLANPVHAAMTTNLIDAYAQDAMGRGQGLPDDVRQRLAPGLRAHPAAFVLLALREAEPVGVAVCFRGFSTFAARPLINIHDLAVVPTCRNQGIGRMLLDEVAAKARALGCCKVTLEVRADNRHALHLYEAAGFSPGSTPHFFWTKPIA